MKSYKAEHTVSSYEVDSDKKMRLFSILNMAQEYAYRHSSSIGFGYEDLAKKDVAWVLSRILVKIRRLPEWRERISMETWHKCQDGLYSVRDFVICDGEGNELVAVTSSWLMLNLSTKRLHRLERFIGDGTDISAFTYGKDAIEERAYRISMPADAEECDSHTVKYSDTDMNGHMNNAKYVEHAMDRIPQEKAGKIRELCVNFNRESMPGQKITFYSSSSVKDDGEHIVMEGRKEDTQCFLSEFVFSEQDNHQTKQHNQ